MEIVKISGTKWYVDIEYKGQIARFEGDLCLDGFAAVMSSMSWIKHIGPLCDGEQQELMRAAYEHSKTNKKCRVRFYEKAILWRQFFMLSQFLSLPGTS